MKSKVFGNIVFVLVLGILLMGAVACSEKSTAGGTVDDNSMAEISADEKLIVEHRVDSTKAFAESAPAGVNDYEVDSTAFWFQITFNGESESYFEQEWENPHSHCFVNIYRSEYGVQNMEWRANNEGTVVRTFFLTADESGVTFHEKMDFLVGSEKICEQILYDFENACEDDGGSLYRHMGTCKDSELHLTCSTFWGHLHESVDDVLDNAAEEMRNQCAEEK